MTIQKEKASLLLAVAIAALGGFGALIAFESAIAYAGARSESAVAESRFALRELQTAREAQSVALDIEHRASALMLYEKPSAQARIILAEIGMIVRKRDLRVSSIRLQPTPWKASEERTRFEEDVYELLIEGTYPQTLLALADLAHASIVARVERVSFERLRHKASTTGEVRATIDLGIFHIHAPDRH